MLILAVETATNWQSVAILDNDQVLATEAFDAGGSHTRSLIPTIDRLFAFLHLSIRDVTGLAVSMGPGSFTGLRVGLATVKGFRLSLGVPMVAVPTLEGMGWNLRGESLPVCPMLKARNGTVYWACFKWKGTSLLRVSEDEMGAVETVAGTIQEPTLCFGDGWLCHQEAFQHARGNMMLSASSQAMKPSAVSVGLASRERFRAGETAPVEVMPRYIQPSYAESEKQQ